MCINALFVIIVRICEHVVGLNLALGRNLFSVLRDIELSLTTNW